MWACEEGVGLTAVCLRGLEARPRGEAHGKAYLAVAGKPMGEKARRRPSAGAQRPVDGHKESPEASKSHTNGSKLERSLGKALLCAPAFSPTPGA